MTKNTNTTDLSLQGLGKNFARGLDTITRAIHETNDIFLGNPETVATAVEDYMGMRVELSSLSIQQQNQLLATVVREQCIKHGFVAAWSCLAKAAPSMGLIPSLVEHVGIAAGIYARIESSSRSGHTIASKMGVGSQASYSKIDCVGPKSLGGNAWRSNEDYMALLKNPAWSDAGYSKGIPPCVAMGWVGVQIKVTPPENAAEVVRMQLLGTIDFDFDHIDHYKHGMQAGFDSAVLHARAAGTKLQAAALVAMLNYDIQAYVRPIQNRWAAEQRGPFNLGPAGVSPEDWTAYLVADCAALVPFVYDEDYKFSRAGMVVGMILLQCQDLLYDAGCSNRVSTVAYAEAAEVATYGIHASFAIAGYDAIAKYFLDGLASRGDDAPPFGFSACMAAGPWGPFSTRYRVWERFVKYWRQMKNLHEPEALALRNIVANPRILKEYDLQRDISAEWARAMKSNASDLVPRSVVKYFVQVDASELLSIPGVNKPQLCQDCGPKFDEAMALKHEDDVRAIPGLPQEVTVGKFGQPARLAVGIRRAASFATSHGACGSCASKIGYWADEAAYIVLAALMHDEPLMKPSMWMLQNYFVGCVGFEPFSIPHLLSGFDLWSDLSFEDEAMGVRDVVDI